MSVKTKVTVPPGSSEALDVRVSSTAAWPKSYARPSESRRGRAERARSRRLRSVWDLVAERLFPAFEDGRLPVGPDRLRALDPRAELGLLELRVLLLELDPVRIARLQVLDQDLAGDLVLAALGDREVDLQEGIAVAVEHRRDTFLLEELDVLEPVQILARCRRHQVDILDERDVLLVRETVPGEELGVEPLDLLRLAVGELVGVWLRLGHGSTARRSATSPGTSRSSSALIASSRFTSARISCSVWPTVYVVPASGTRAIAEASIVSAARSSGSSECTFVLPHARASICSSIVIAVRKL